MKILSIDFYIDDMDSRPYPIQCKINHPTDKFKGYIFTEDGKIDNTFMDLIQYLKFSALFN